MKIQNLVLYVRPLLVALTLFFVACLPLLPIPATAAELVAAHGMGKQAPGQEDHAYYTCGGAMETRIWQLWETQGRAYLTSQQVQARLLDQGDTYALYDIQILFHNLAGMAQRCRRTDRLVQLADDLMPLFDALQPLPGGQPGEMAWVCRGGEVCNARNRLVNTEVMLVSMQGLGLLSALARDLATSDDAQARNHPLIEKTVQTSLAHLRRWGGPSQVAQWRRAAEARPEDVKSGSANLCFLDIHLWQIAIYANLAGVAAVQPQWFDAAQPSSEAHRDLSAAIGALLHFFQRRVTRHELDSPRLGRVQVADLDAGYWRLFGDNRFAGYSGNASPAVCRPVNSAKPAGGGGQSPQIGKDRPWPWVGSISQPMRAELRIDPASIPVVPDLGWDISHARRLVQVLAALHANRQAMAEWWGLAPQQLPSADLARAFAAQLLARVWNGDVQSPLFTNYFNGANGWLRAGYDNGTGRCYVGYPPFGLSDSFATGGYAQWAEYFPQLSELARTIYQRTQSNKPDDLRFVEQYYFYLALDAEARRHLEQQIMFWPSLVR